MVFKCCYHYCLWVYPPFFLLLLRRRPFFTKWIFFLQIFFSDLQCSNATLSNILFACFQCCETLCRSFLEGRWEFFFFGDHLWIHPLSEPSSCHQHHTFLPLVNWSSNYFFFSRKKVKQNISSFFFRYDLWSSLYYDKKKVYFTLQNYYQWDRRTSRLF